MDAVRDQREGACVATVGAGASSYRRHRPEETVLYGVVEQHAEAFFEGQGERGRAMAQFVGEEFEAYLRGGRLEQCFIGAKCRGCRHEHLVGFSCKGRGWCPSCASRRMAESGAIWSATCYPRQRIASGCCRSPGRCACCSRRGLSGSPGSLFRTLDWKSPALVADGGSPVNAVGR